MWSLFTGLGLQDVRRDGSLILLGRNQCYFFGLFGRPLPFLGLFHGHLTVPFTLHAVIVAGGSALNPAACGHIGRQAFSP